MQPEIEQQGRGDQRDDHHSTEFSAESTSISGFEIRPFSRGRQVDSRAVLQAGCDLVD